MDPCTVPFDNMRTLKFKAQLTNGFFATVNQTFDGSSQLPTTAEHCLNCAQRFDYCVSAIIGNWGEPPNIWLIVAKNAVVGWALNFSLHVLDKCSNAASLDIILGTLQFSFLLPLPTTEQCWQNTNEETDEWILPFSNNERWKGSSCYDWNSKHLHVFQLNLTRLVRLTSQTTQTTSMPSRGENNYILSVFTHQVTILRY